MLILRQFSGIGAHLHNSRVEELESDIIEILYDPCRPDRFENFVDKAVWTSIALSQDVHDSADGLAILNFAQRLSDKALLLHFVHTCSLRCAGVEIS